ncbi:TonB-dependent receptor [Cesiribacter sp. SM1]|uniref:SusC/RagA family TonB-linked outer membrane protein n=1 Tax=Cesiribacter sp. SM1 TaxID=2861196 RepID=UPI001CD2BB33|nr:TonB-dependent receptor [Cesiribacter sp. SM1]
MNISKRKTVPRLLPHFFCGGLLMSLSIFSPAQGEAYNQHSFLSSDQDFTIEKKGLNAANVYAKNFIKVETPETTASLAVDQMRVTGTVTNTEDGMGMPGVAIRVKGTSLGVVTDIDGKYSLEVPSESSVLVFSYIGYVTEEVTVGGKTTINLEMYPDLETLEEVVVVGYGTQKKSDLTGAVGDIEGAKIAERGTVNPLQAVQGQVAGVDISAGSGRAGAGYNIRIRGQNSLEGGNPLFVVDGIIVDDIDFLNPQDIESMNILKDASSTAIYGSRGSNGVVIISTKRGANVQQTSIAYEGYYGIRQNARMPDFMTGDEWWEYRQNTYISGELEAGRPYDATVGGVTGSPLLRERLANRDYYDWQSAFLQTGQQQNHWLTISGTSKEKMNYLIGAGYQEEKGNLMNEFFKRYNFKASVSHKISDRWEAGSNFNFSLMDREQGSQNAVTNAYRMSPLVTPYDSTGELLFQPAKYDGISFTSSVNPLLDMANSEDNTRRIYGVGNLFLQYNPVEWLNIRTTFSPEIDFRRRGRYWGSLTEARGGAAPAASRETREDFSYIWDNLVTANKQFNNHSLTFTGLFSMQYDRRESEFINVLNLPFNSSHYNLGSAGPDNVQDVGSNYIQRSLLSYMARVNYSLMDKYLLTLSARWDGSSVLAPGYKWSAFPSAAIAWRVIEEGFMQNIGFISNLKARLSYGYTGNNNIDPYSTAVLAGDGVLYGFGDQTVNGFPAGSIVNPALTWERTRELNFGVDYGFFNGRVNGSVDVYDKLSTGLLMERDLPLESGSGSLIDNIGSVSNKGFEIALQTFNIQTRDISWSTSFNFSKNRNEIIEIFGGEVTQYIGEDDTWIVGQPVAINYNYVFGGIWQESERDQALLYGQTPGMAKVLDLDSDGVITGDDRAVLGSPFPSWTGGVSTTLNVKQFDLSASLFTRQGVQVYSPFHAEFTALHDRGRAKLNVNYYMPANEVTHARESNEYPQPNNVGSFWRNNGVGYYKDASFVKVQNISLGYTFSKELLERVKMQNLRVYLNVLNPFVFTDYDGFDPEWAEQSLNNTGNSYITYQLGVNARF